MSMERKAEVLEMPTQENTDVAQTRRIAQGRAAVERYVERVENATERLKCGPEVSELYCALAELREGMIENAPELAHSLYEKALDAFKLSHAANLGLRRLNRAQGNYDQIIESIERELATAQIERKRALQLELARTWLYCAKDAEKAIQVLESLDDFDDDSDGDKQKPFNAETFLLWEDALIATCAWDRYETMLRNALAQQKSISAITQHLMERLWILYRYILPDEKQASILCSHLLKLQPLDDELVEDELLRAQKNNNPDGVVSILKRAIERLQGSPREQYYRSLLADTAAYRFDDPDHALDVLADNNSENDLIQLHQQLILMADSGNAEAYLDAMAHSIELVYTPQLKAEQLHEIACILRDDMDQEDAAIDVFCEASEVCPTYEPTIEALADYYTRESMWEKLAQLYEYEISYATEHKLPEYSPEVFMARHARLARLYENKLHLAFPAFNHYQSILKYRPDDIIALKGASRMTQSVGNWTELLQLYAAAEGCTQDVREHAYLLERIAQIADIYLNDADTACTALEALRDLAPSHTSTLPALARLYVKLQKWDELIKLTDEEIESVNTPEYKASLLCRNAEVSEIYLSNIPQTILYYEKARSVSTGCRQASAELIRIYRQQKAWEKLVDLLKSEADLTADACLKCAHLRMMAHILDIELDSLEEAIEVYENCLKLNPRDTISRHYLLSYYRQNEKWEDVLRILSVELETGGTLGAPWLTAFWMGRIEMYRLNDEPRALKSFAKAFELNPDDITIFRTWLSLALRIGDDNETRETLEKSIDRSTNEQLKNDILLAQADIILRSSNDPKSIESYIQSIVSSSDVCSRGMRLVSTIHVILEATYGRWISRLAIAFKARQAKEIRIHALLAAVVLELPEEIRPAAHEVLCQLGDMDLARNLWANLMPASRPDYKRLPAEILTHASHEAQDLRRWCAISKLLDGNIEDPTDSLLPDNRDDSISYRPDLELLAAYFERFENWNKLLEVLNVQEENTLNEEESIQVTLQKAWVLSKIRKPEEALACVRRACKRCSFENPMRLSLYDYLENEKDWDFLQEQIRQHLMNSDDHEEKSSLWLRLSDINKKGMDNLEESLRCQNNAYQETPEKGDILCEIANTAQKIGEFDIARRALDDFIRLHHPSLEKQLELEPQLLELHFNHEGGDTQRMLDYFDELVKKTIQSRDCLIILAKAHAIAGDPQIAAEIILRIAVYPFVENDIQLWIILADLYLDRLGEQQKGEKLLWELFKCYPTKEGIFDRINKLYHTPAERRMMVDNLKNCVKASAPIANNSALVRKYLGFAAQILGNELGAWKEAQDLYSQALEASSEPAQDLVKNRAYARCRVPGEALSAYREFCDLLVHDPFQPDIYRAAFDICRRNDARDRERILRQLASIFVPEAGLSDNADLRPKMMDSRLLNDDVLMKHLTHPSLRPVQVLLHESMQILNNCLRNSLPVRTNLGSEKIRNQSITGLFSMCAAAFGINSIKGFCGHDASPMPMVLEDPAAYWISDEIWEEMRPDVQRHWAGYASGLLWTGISKLVWYEPREVWQLLDGCYYLVTDRGITERNAYTIDAAERINSPFNRGVRKDIARIIDEIGPQNIPQSKAGEWLEGLYATADRAGLLFSGSLTSSIPAILEAEGWNPNKTGADYLAARFKQSRRIPELIEFALSDDYLELRYHAGLAMQPSKING